MVRRQPKKKKMTRHEHHTILWPTIEGASMASSPTWISHATNKHKTTPAPQNKPMMVALRHAYLVPPHSSASRNMTAQPANRKKPGKSRLDRVARVVVFGCDFLYASSGMWMMRRTNTATAPIGRLMKKPKTLALLVVLWMEMIRTPTPACVLS